MKKQVDLFSPQLVPRQLRINARLVAGVWGVLIAIMVFAGVSSSMVVTSTEQEAASATRAKRSLEQQYQNLMAAQAARKVSPELLAAFEQAKREASIKGKLLRLVAESEQTHEQPYSALMADLASVDEPRIWLQQIAITGQQLTLVGMAAEAELIPGWIQQVGEQGYLKGKSFNQLVISEQEQQHSFSLRTVPAATSGHTANASRKATASTSPLPGGLKQ
ncbi:PilN domain-containing protein [Neiella marina]|uniref:PilN domain-containing protein n=1 Tax=Neiella holothuriorum TaxID=2870530 RepID=A0ABS7EB51_9GAMM|nr:PilN domain-containing protein [Neiella holothuriorum]MBW8189434.1 PilN domain-containing protein [Neiella holothuriorum]